MPKVTIAAIILAAVAIPPASAAEPSVADILGKPHDCVIQPFVATELGSSATGILEEFLVDRGDRVKKGMVVARLRSDLEQASLDLAKARAESTRSRPRSMTAVDSASTCKKRMRIALASCTGSRYPLQPSSIKR